MFNTLDTIEETVKFADFGRKRITKIYIKNFKKGLLNEELLGVAFDCVNPKNQLFLTNKRIIFIKVDGPISVKSKSIQIDNITSLDFDKFGTWSKINVTSKNDAEGISYVPFHIGYEINLILEEMITK